MTKEFKYTDRFGDDLNIEFDNDDIMITITSDDYKQSILLKNYDSIKLYKRLKKHLKAQGLLELSLKPEDKPRHFRHIGAGNDFIVEFVTPQIGKVVWVNPDQINENLAYYLCDSYYGKEQGFSNILNKDNWVEVKWKL